jgi:predicted RNA-binding Zn ribbon-like protein
MSTDAVIPPDLDLIRTFVNTADVESGSDEVATPEALTSWLRQRGHMAAGDTLAADDVFRAQAVREALRAVLLANNGEPLDPEAVRTLNRAAADAPLQALFDPSGHAALAPARAGISAFVATLLAAVARAEADGTWWRLKACSAHTCQWAFYDHSRNRSRTWCAMGVCGNRSKARSYRQRQKSA